MKLVVLGGTGTLGRAVVARGVAAGHEVISVSRRAPADATPGVTHRAADVTRGEGLAAALEGADAVVDATNALQGARQVLVDGTRRALEAARTAGVKHFVGVSIVGIDDAPFDYYRTKVAQEAVIAEGIVPWSVLRATQFHDLIATFARGRLGVAFLPTGWKVQPVDVTDVAPFLVDAAAAGPAGRLPDVAGPEVRVFWDLARAWRKARGKRRLPIPVPLPGAKGRFLRGGGLCNPDRAVGKITFEEWLAAERAARSTTALR